MRYHSGATSSKNVATRGNDCYIRSETGSKNAAVRDKNAAAWGHNAASIAKLAAKKLRCGTKMLLCGIKTLPWGTAVAAVVMQLAASSGKSSNG